MTEDLRGLELRSRVSADGELLLSLEQVTAPRPGSDDVVVQMQAAPINPSDLGLLFGWADPSKLQAGTQDGRPTLTATIPPDVLGGMAARFGQSLPAGNEGAGLVVQAGENAQALLGKTVGMWGGAMYATYRTISRHACLELPPDATAADGASMFVNPLTALAMTETMRAEGHTALVHTAAASNLGQMLNRICIADGISLVNIVRSAEQAAILHKLGAKYVLDSKDADFRAKLTDAMAETGATIAFDAIGGGALANTILHAMESAANRKATAYSRYGSDVLKQVYIYGMLDTGPTTLDRFYGFAWSVSGFLLTPFLGKIGREGLSRLQDRVKRELKTTFASSYTDTISLADALRPEVARAYARKATGEKFLIDPSR